METHDASRGKPAEDDGTPTEDAPDLTDTTFVYFVPASAAKVRELTSAAAAPESSDAALPESEDAALPVLLFQTGYGSDSDGHLPLLAKIAEGGWIVVVPDRKADTAGGKAAAAALFERSEALAAVSTDGTHLAAALDWVKRQETIGGRRPDLSKVAAAGFAMGCIELLNFAAAHPWDLGAIVAISCSTSAELEGPFGFKEEELLEKAANLKCASLWITSDKDCQLEATSALYRKAGSAREEGLTGRRASLVTFVDVALDRSMALTDETSIWPAAMADEVPGLAQHFGLAAERGVVSDAPLLGFLGAQMLGGEPFFDPLGFIVADIVHKW